jgi:spore germination protein KC
VKVKKILIILLVIVITAFFLTNFSSIYTIDDYAYVIAMGLDNSDDSDLILSLQIAIPAGSSKGSESSSSQSSSSIVSTVKCKNINGGVNLINDYLGQKLNLSYCKAMVFSEEIAKKGIGNYICTATNDIEIRPSCDIIVSKCSALDYITNSKPLLENLSSKYYEIASSSQKDTGLTRTISLMSFYNRYYDSLCEPYAPLSSIEESNSEDAKNEVQGKTLNSDKNSDNSNVGDSSSSSGGKSEGEGSDSNSGGKSESEGSSSSSGGKSESSSKKDIEKDNANAKIKNQGLAIFKDDKLIGEISREETLCYMLVSGKLKDAVINIPSPFEDSDYVSLNISSVHSKNKVEIKNGTPFITCNISLSARVLSSTKTSNYLSKENSLALEYATNSYLNANVTDFLYKTSKELKSDFIGFGRNAVRSFKTMDDWKNYDWLNKYQNSEFNVNVNTTVKSSYLLIG